MRKKLKILFGLILLLVLVAGGFALGVYLRLFDTQALNEEYGLHKLPIICAACGERGAYGAVLRQYGAYARAQYACCCEAEEGI